MNNHVETISLAFALMRFWAGLECGDKEMLINGINAILKIALWLPTKPPLAAIKTRLLRDGDEDGDAEHDLAI